MKSILAKLRKDCYLSIMEQDDKKLYRGSVEGKWREQQLLANVTVY